MANVKYSNVKNTFKATQNEIKRASEQGRLTVEQAVNQMIWLSVQENGSHTCYLRFFDSEPEKNELLGGMNYGTATKSSSTNGLQSGWYATLNFDEDDVRFKNLTEAKSAMLENAISLLNEHGYIAQDYVDIIAKNKHFNFTAIIRDFKGEPFFVNTRMGDRANIAPFVNGKPVIHCDNPTVNLENYIFKDEWWEYK